MDSLLPVSPHVSAYAQVVSCAMSALDGTLIFQQAMPIKESGENPHQFQMVLVEVAKVTLPHQVLRELRNALNESLERLDKQIQQETQIAQAKNHTKNK